MLAQGPQEFAALINMRKHSFIAPSSAGEIAEIALAVVDIDRLLECVDLLEDLRDLAAQTRGMGSS